LTTVAEAENAARLRMNQDDDDDDDREDDESVVSFSLVSY